MNKLDYYEFLQISPNADQETIHRVYRYLGARFHPDNPISGNAETFFRLKTAYEVLSDPANRARYDAARKTSRLEIIPMSTSIDFMDGLEGETNRRMAVLTVLYLRRRSNPANPEVSLADIETRMGFPRDYLDFTTWYLQKKSYITKADNSDFTITVQGVDFVETQRVSLPVLNKLLTNGMHAIGPETSVDFIELDHIGSSAEPFGAPKDRRTRRVDRRKNSGIVLPTGVILDRRIGDRRTPSNGKHQE